MLSTQLWFFFTNMQDTKSVIEQFLNGTSAQYRLLE